MLLLAMVSNLRAMNGELREAEHTRGSVQPGRTRPGVLVIHITDSPLKRTIEATKTSYFPKMRIVNNCVPNPILSTTIIPKWQSVHCFGIPKETPGSSSFCSVVPFDDPKPATVLLRRVRLRRSPRLHAAALREGLIALHR